MISKKEKAWDMYKSRHPQTNNAAIATCGYHQPPVRHVANVSCLKALFLLLLIARTGRQNRGWERLRREASELDNADWLAMQSAAPSLVGRSSRNVLKFTCSLDIVMCRRADLLTSGSTPWEPSTLPTARVAMRWSVRNPSSNR